MVENTIRPICKPAEIPLTSPQDTKMEMKKMFVNMTPHAINLLTTEGENIATIEPSGSMIRLDEEWSPIGTFDIEGHSVDLMHCEYSSGSIPSSDEGTIFIVSAMVANNYPERKDFVIPAQIVRSEDRRTILGCTAFASATNLHPN